MNDMTRQAEATYYKLCYNNINMQFTSTDVVNIINSA